MKAALVRWVTGIAALLVIDIIAEALVFEWLAWNGTTKNDWFFMLWWACLLYTSPSPRDVEESRMPSSA